jgi:epoxyqueuosine reductase
MMKAMALGLILKERALEAGFDLVGIAPLGAGSDLGFSRRWVDQGYGGEMRYLANPRRDDPRQLLPSAKSVICVGLVYNSPYPYSTEVCQQDLSRPRAAAREPRREALSNESRADSPRAWLSRYAWGRDYHGVMRERLERLRSDIQELAPGVETRVYVDTGPIVERAFARFSGIGWMGKNTCLINEQKGSWFFLGVILTSLELKPDLPAPDRCGSCTRCLEACPTGALIEPYVMDASRCISYFTIELRGPIPEEFRPAMGANVFGCDICQDVCPWNSKDRSQESEGRSQDERDRPAAASHRLGQTATTTLPQFQPMPIEVESPAPASRQGAREHERPAIDNPRRAAPVSLFNPPLEMLATLKEEDFRRLFARSPVKRAKYRGWLRNLCVAMGNSGDGRFIPWLESARKHPDPVIREHARWALHRLQAKSE